MEDFSKIQPPKTKRERKNNFLNVVSGNLCLIRLPMFIPIKAGITAAADNIVSSSDITPRPPSDIPNASVAVVKQIPIA
jgi:hypothetical protein